MIALSFGLCLWLGPWASTARAADIAEEADLLFQMGIRDYTEGAYDNALVHLLASYRLVPNRNVEFNIARIYEQQGQLDLAWTHYYRYVQATPDATARADGEAALGRLDKQVARVKITSVPPGATVYVNRDDLGSRGVTPMTIALPAGKRAIILDLDGYVRAETTAELGLGRETRTAVELLPAPPTARQASPTANQFLAVVRAGSEVVVTVDPSTCSLLPARVAGAGKPRPHPGRGGLEVAPGSVLATLAPLPLLALDVTVNDLTGRTTFLAREDDRELGDAALLRTWVFDRCTPTGGADAKGGASGLATALESLPPASRAVVAAVFAEWAVTRGGRDVPKAMQACTNASCGALVAALVAP